MKNDFKILKKEFPDAQSSIDPNRRFDNWNY